MAKNIIIEKSGVYSLWQKREKTINEYLNLLGKALDSLEKCEHESDYMSYYNGDSAKTVYEYIYKCVLVMINGFIEFYGENVPAEKGKRKSIDYYRENIKNDSTAYRCFNTLHNMAYVCGCRNKEVSCSHLELTLGILKDLFYHYLNFTNKFCFEKYDKTTVGKVALQFARLRLSKAVDLKKISKHDELIDYFDNRINYVRLYYALDDGLWAIEHACQILYGDDYDNSDLENEVSIIQHYLIIDDYTSVCCSLRYINSIILKPYRKVLKMFKQELSDAASSMRHDDPRSGLEKALEDVEKGRVRSAKNVRDLMEQIFKK